MGWFGRISAHYAASFISSEMKADPVKYIEDIFAQEAMLVESGILKDEVIDVDSINFAS